MLGLAGFSLRQNKGTVAQAAVEAEAFDAAPVLARYQAELGVDAASARRHWRELVRFLMMVGHAGKRGYGMYGPIDKLWHHFVLHTELYQAFCDRHAGRFLHHYPTGSGRAVKWLSGYLRFLIDYRTVFGELPPEDVWPLPVVPGVSLPKTLGCLRARHVKVMAIWEGGRGQGALLGVSPLGGYCGAGAEGSSVGVLDAGGDGGGGDAGGCGSGGDG
jgi:hypothetical protein